MRGLPARVLSTLLSALALLLPAQPVAAQPEPAVQLTLTSQSAWTDRTHPLQLSFRATNLSDSPLTSLSVGLVVLAPATSRSVYELSLRADTGPPVLAVTYFEQGTLEPGQTRSFRIRQSVAGLVAHGDSALYPLRVELRSEDVPVAVLRTPMVFLIERPKIPLNLAWTWVLSAVDQVGPDGVFLPGSLQEDLAPGGRLATAVDALAGLGPTPVDLVVSSVLVDQLRRMGAGYRLREGNSVLSVPAGVDGAADAARVLSQLRGVAARPGVELVATPLGDPDLPALFRAGRISDLPRLVEEGSALVREVMGRAPRSDVARPPDSAVDPATLPALTRLGATTLLADPTLAPSPRYGTPPTARLAAGRTSVTAVLPDPEVAALVQTYAPADPRLGAQAVLGYLASIWFEAPGTPRRGVAVLFGEDEVLPSDFLGAFAALVRASPWLRPLPASRFVQEVPPSRRQALVAPPSPSFPPAYLQALARARASLARLAASARGARPQVERMARLLLMAEGGTSLRFPTFGQRFIQAVEAAVGATFRRVRITTDVAVTLTSRNGVIPLTFKNDNAFPIRLGLRFVTDRRLLFPGGLDQRVTLPPGRRTLTFPVRAQTTGRIPIRIQLLAWGGGGPPAMVADRPLVIRSTAYNRVALFITVGAALFLLAWWARRLVPRRRP